MLLTTAAVMSALVLLASGGAWAFTGWASGRLDRIDPFGALGDRPEDGPRGALTFLLVGADDRSGLTREELDRLNLGRDEGGARTDTMMLVHLNRERDAISVVALPRDSWVTIPGHGPAKINAAYSFGGPQLAVQTVERATGVRIDHYAEVNFLGFLRVVDALGGVRICLPEPISDPRSGLQLPAGTHVVDGAGALAYVRTRSTAGGDLDRIDRQQRFISALLEAATDTRTLSDPARFTAFSETVLQTVTVDDGLTGGALLELGNQLRSVSMDDVTFTTVPAAQTDFTAPTGESAVLWDTEAARELFGRISRDEPLAEPSPPAAAQAGGAAEEPAQAAPELIVPPADITVQVRNGAGIQGLGARADEELRAAGFNVPVPADNWVGGTVEQTVVRHAAHRADSARTVAAALPGSRLERAGELGDGVEVVLGPDYQGVRAVEAAAPDSAGSGGIQAATATDNVCA
ncbi:LCP family protein [Allonocardiopsis opalescens]|uniref:LytR family transcriptional attenuator n=1 Tax=Allonocardiopsis opalescens TaxID=1144618 RepID=A0A2T0QBX2_9ACTN|nr:LCP family protein [Allonocardiopsis opalescens]PRY01454.1 LytR family transcriptional attenuator [Allonocardiopsis opalescens]